VPSCEESPVRHGISKFEFVRIIQFT
jgi:hypothetical protein